jgi:16S rRNA (adenine1518-N6/adenine1519-N6)-dimethyltransferase
VRHIARKRFGQHFLTDDAVIEAITRAINPKAGQILVEIGPGLAALTKPLVERAGHLIVIELDRDLAARLRADTRLQVVQADALTVDFEALLPTNRIMTSEGGGTHEEDGGALKLRLCGNLPYNISTALLFHVLQWAHCISDQHFMLQKEVVDRMIAVPATNDYGRLSVMLQWRYAMESILNIGPQSFDPPPKVHSALVRMVSRPNPAPVDVAIFTELVRTAFSQRRKILRHTLGRWLDEKGFTGDFDIQRRAQEVSVAEYVALALAVGG